MDLTRVDVSVPKANAERDNQDDRLSSGIGTVLIGQARTLAASRDLAYILVIRRKHSDRFDIDQLRSALDGVLGAISQDLVEIADVPLR